MRGLTEIEGRILVYAAMIPCDLDDPDVEWPEWEPGEEEAACRMIGRGLVVLDRRDVIGLTARGRIALGLYLAGVAKMAS